MRGTTISAVLAVLLLPTGFVLGAGINVQLMRDVLKGVSPGCTVFVLCDSSSDCSDDLYSDLDGLDVAFFIYSMDSGQEGLLDHLIQERQVLGENYAICNILFVSLNESAGGLIMELENRFFTAKSLEIYAFVGREFMDSYQPLPVMFSTHLLEEKSANSYAEESFNSPIDSHEAVYVEHLQCPFSSSFAMSNAWSSSSGFVLPVSKCNPNLLNARHIKVAMSVQAYAPFLNFVDGKVTGGADLDVFTIAAKKLNFSFDIHYEDIYGAPTPDGAWIGLVGVVWNGSCTFGLGHVLEEAFYHQAVDNLHYLYTLNLVIIAPKPKPVLPFMNILDPFSLTVWIIVIVTLVSVIVTIFGIMKYSEFVEGKKKYTATDMVYIPLFETLGTLLNQSDIIYENFHKPAKEVLVWFWLIGEFFIKSFYVSLLFGFLITIEFDTPINTVSDVLAKGKHLFVFANTPFIEFLRASDIPSYKAIYQQIIENNQFTTTVDSMLPYDFEKKLLEDGNCYLLTYQMALASFPAESARWGYQPFRIADQNVFPFFGGFIGRKHAQENPILDNVLSHLLDAGIVEHLIDGYIKPEFLHPPPEGDAPAEPITYMHLLGIYVALALGLVVGAILFLSELGHKTHKVARKRRQDYKIKQLYPDYPY